MDGKIHNEIEKNQSNKEEWILEKNRKEYAWKIEIKN